MEGWLRERYWNEETGRLEFPRGSAPRAVMQSLLRKVPAGWREEPKEGKIAVEVPTFKGVNPATYCWLSETGRSVLVGACKKLFRAQLWEELGPLMGHDVCITEVVYEFMDSHGIEPTEKNWEAIRQMYMRMRKKTQGKEG